ncbi:MAG: 4Fe-4S dicluster domain-containing protein [Oscillospiraceae bacterium]|jgi:electron transport complex protein RnfC|nr:4Fe-4S dicluster domain-containing protein [Oscillospiraceae bacterium]
MILLHNRGVPLEGKKNIAFDRTLERHKPREYALVPLFTYGTHQLIPNMGIGENVTRFAPLAVSPSGKHAMIAPVPGVLLGVEEKQHPFFGRVNCARISVNYRLPAAELYPSDWLRIKPHDIINIAKGAGIVDEYDGIPLYRKLKAYAQSRVDRLAGNAIDDDPFVSSGVKVLAEFGSECASGLELCMRAVGAEQGTIYYYDLGGREIRRIKPRYGVIRCEAVIGNYPLWPALERKLAGKSGFGKIGVQALYALYGAVTYGLPQTESVITVAGDGIANAGNYLVTSGTTVGDLLTHVGLITEPEYIILNSAMNGTLCLDYDTALIHGMRALICLKRRAVVAEKSGCIGCGRCVSECPAGVLPYYAVKLAEKGDLTDAKRFGTHKCIGCGVCSAVCPAGREMTESIARINANINLIEP